MPSISAGDTEFCALSPYGNRAAVSEKRPFPSETPFFRVGRFFRVCVAVDEALSSERPSLDLWRWQKRGIYVPRIYVPLSIEQYSVASRSSAAETPSATDKNGHSAHGRAPVTSPMPAIISLARHFFQLRSLSLGLFFLFFVCFSLLRCGSTLKNFSVYYCPCFSAFPPPVVCGSGDLSSPSSPSFSSSLSFEMFRKPSSILYRRGHVR